MAPGASLGALENKPGMSFSFMGIVLATPLSIQDSPPLRRVDWRRRLRDAGEEEPDSRFEIQDRRIRHPFLLQNKANNLLKTQGSVPKSDKTKPSSDTFPPFPWAGLGRGKPRPYSRDTKGGAPGYLAIPKAAAAVRLGSSFCRGFEVWEVWRPFLRPVTIEKLDLRSRTRCARGATLPSRMESRKYGEGNFWSGLFLGR